ncbi:hypothetical protein KIN20_028391 [Parelaphostrongylus tenuis]|uniref:Uncharacterized protein n=1 Tax=Parelaphostrongylus tenuis TaxID=148309 RepID=A0AAD5WEN9_PARTN|nr:hypothetical protein KIN20_028391 [Parelaphostrongylus tenuis]
MGFVREVGQLLNHKKHWNTKKSFALPRRARTVHSTDIDPAMSRKPSGKLLLLKASFNRSDFDHWLFKISSSSSDTKVEKCTEKHPKHMERSKLLMEGECEKQIECWNLWDSHSKTLVTSRVIRFCADQKADNVAAIGNEPTIAFTSIVQAPVLGRVLLPYCRSIDDV